MIEEIYTNLQLSGKELLLVLPGSGVLDGPGCQSLAKPSVLLYWHMGDTPIRFRNSIPLICKGENITLAMRSQFRRIKTKKGAQSGTPFLRYLAQHVVRPASFR